MSELFRMRYGDRTPHEVLQEYIRTHPGCTRTEMKRDLPSVSHESYLLRMLRRGELRKAPREDGTLGYWMEEAS